MAALGLPLSGRRRSLAEGLLLLGVTGGVISLAVESLGSNQDSPSVVAVYLLSRLSFSIVPLVALSMLWDVDWAVMRLLLGQYHFRMAGLVLAWAAAIDFWGKVKSMEHPNTAGSAGSTLLFFFPNAIVLFLDGVLLSSLSPRGQSRLFRTLLPRLLALYSLALLFLYGYSGVLPPVSLVHRTTRSDTGAPAPPVGLTDNGQIACALTAFVMITSHHLLRCSHDTAGKFINWPMVNSGVQIMKAPADAAAQLRAQSRPGLS